MTKSDIKITGLRKKPTYDELVEYIDEDKDKIRYPNRAAKQLREAPELAFLDGEGLVEIEKQQQNIVKAQQKEQVIRSAGASGSLSGSVVEERARTSSSSSSAANSFKSTHDETQSFEIFTQDDDMGIDQAADNISSVAEAVEERRKEKMRDIENQAVRYLESAHQDSTVNAAHDITMEAIANSQQQVFDKHQAAGPKYDSETMSSQGVHPVIRFGKRATPKPKAHQDSTVNAAHDMTETTGVASSSRDMTETTGVASSSRDMRLGSILESGGAFTMGNVIREGVGLAGTALIAGPEAAAADVTRRAVGAVGRKVARAIAAPKQPKPDIEEEIKELSIAGQQAILDDIKATSGPNIITTGTYWDKKSEKWRAQIDMHGRRKSLGYFNNREDAALAYQKAKNGYEEEKKALAKTKK